MTVLDKCREDMNRLAYAPNLRIKAIQDLENILSMSAEERKKQQEQRLIAHVKHAAKNSNFYSNLYKDYGIDIEKMDIVKEFNKLPFTNKNHLREQYPFGMLASDIRDVNRYAESTGTTGQPTSAYFSREDWFENNIFVSYRLADIFSPDDVAIIAAPYELSVPAQDLERIFEILGTSVIACGILNEVCSWERLINIIKNVQPTVLMCSGTRSLLIAEMAKQMGYDPCKDFSIRKILNIAETVNTSKAQKIKESWNADVYNAYGTTETCALAVSCKHGKMHLFDERYYYEVIDPITEESLDYGEKGELVVTLMTNKSMPLVRYKTGDLVSINKSDCQCGNISPILTNYGRIGDEIKLDDYCVSYVEMEEIILSCRGQDKFFEVEITDEDVSITLDLKDGASLDEAIKNIYSQIPDKVHSKIKINKYDSEGRKNRFMHLKNSNKPFGGFCFRRKQS